MKGDWQGARWRERVRGFPRVVGCVPHGVQKMRMDAFVRVPNTAYLSGARRRATAFSMTEFEGCLYASPAADANDVRWAERDGLRYPIDLTVSQMVEMQSRLVGLPVRIEHDDRKGSSYDNCVGRVVQASVDPSSGYTRVRMRLDEGTKGAVAAYFIAEGKVRDLSLGHVVYPEDGRVDPVEVSICREGAREGTHIYGINAEAKGAVRCTRVEASANRMSTPTPTLPPSSVPAVPTPAPASTAAPAAAAAPQVSPEPASVHAEAGSTPVPADDHAQTGTKRLRDEKGRFETEPSAPEPQREPSITELVESIASKLPEQDQERLFGMVSRVMEGSATAQDKANEAAQKSKHLQELVDTLRSSQTNTAAQIIAMMNSLYSDHAQQYVMNDNEINEATKSIMDNPALLRALQGVPVMANAVKYAQHTAVQQQAETARLGEAAAMQKVNLRALEQRLAHASGMGGGNSLWESPPPPVTHAPPATAATAFAPPPAATPVPVLASATGNAAAPKRQKLTPDWLVGQIGGYNVNANGIENMYPGDV